MSTFTQLEGLRRHGPVVADILAASLAVLAAVQLGLAAFMAAAPHAFYSSIGPFGTQNDHYVRDVATFYAALGVGLAVAVRRESWRVPVLAITTAQYALHTLNHLLDIGAAHPRSAGYVDFLSLAATTLALAWLLQAARALAPAQPQSHRPRPSGARP